MNISVLWKVEKFTYKFWNHELKSTRHKEKNIGNKLELSQETVQLQGVAPCLKRAPGPTGRVGSAW
jgi:hypothetical protein